MEDYEKKYEEALDTIKKIKAANKDNKELVDFIEYKYPELKESEDERIRKEIISYLRGCYGAGSEDHLISKRKQWAAWLEKGEQKFADNLRWNELTWEDVNTIEEIINEVHSDFRNGIGEESFGEEVLERFRETKGEEYVDAYEQRPSWSEEDEEMFDAIIADIQFTQKAHTHDDNQVVYEREIDWLKSLKERYTWKPSDKQMDTLEQWLKDNRYSGDERYCYPIFDSLYQDLKKLREE